MAASLHFLVFCSLLLTPLTSAKTSQGPAALVLPVTKDLATLQYVTEIRSTSPNHSPTKLVVDLGGRLIWVDYETGRFSSVYRTVERRSIQCSAATAGSTSPAPGCNENTCSSVTDNTITGLSIGGKIAEDVISIPSIEGSIISMVDSFLLSHVPTFLLQGLASGARGMAGLGRGRIGLPSQLAGSLGLDRKFTMCLPSSSKGFVVFGKNNVVSNSLMYTPLITNDSSVSHEYYIGVKSIRINGKRLSLNKSLLSKDDEGIGGTKLSTVVPYTTFERSIYFSVTEAFIEALVLLNMTRVTPVAPFDVCFSSRNIAKTELEPAVPVMDLVLQSELVKWRIHWASSMVRVSEDVMCLGFLDGGLRPRTSIVIGGHQLENNLLDFDLARLRIGFGSLLNRNTDFHSHTSMQHQGEKGINGETPNNVSALDIVQPIDTIPEANLYTHITLNPLLDASIQYKTSPKPCNASNISPKATQIQSLMLVEPNPTIHIGYNASSHTEKLNAALVATHVNPFACLSTMENQDQLCNTALFASTNPIVQANLSLSL